MIESDEISNAKTVKIYVVSISGLRYNFFPLARPDQTVPYGTVLSRDAVPGTSCQATIGVVPTGRKYILRAEALIKLALMGNGVG